MNKEMNSSAPTMHLRKSAILYLSDYLADNKKAKGIRFYTKKTGCSGYSYQTELMDSVLDSDIKAMTNSALPIYLKQESVALLNHITVNLVKKKLGQKVLVYENPNEAAKCGCGESFSVK